jgi:hypothetical protein
MGPAQGALKPLNSAKFCRQLDTARTGRDLAGSQQPLTADPAQLKAAAGEPPGVRLRASGRGYSQLADGSTWSPATTPTVDPDQPLAVVLPSVGSALSPAMVGGAYAQNFFLSGGAAPYTWAVAAGQLPPGLTLQTFGEPTDADNELAGTPTTTVSRQPAIQPHPRYDCSGLQQRPDGNADPGWHLQLPHAGAGLTGQHCDRDGHYHHRSVAPSDGRGPGTVSMSEALADRAVTGAHLPVRQ